MQKNAQREKSLKLWELPPLLITWRRFGYLFITLVINCMIISHPLVQTWASDGAPWPTNGSAPVKLEIEPFSTFIVGNDKTEFGALRFAGGVVLRSQSDDFGGFSGLAIAPDGSYLLAISDKGDWLSARMNRVNGRLEGLSNVVTAPLLGSDGSILNKGAKWYADAEGLHLRWSPESRDALISFERQRGKLRRIPLGREGLSGWTEVLPESELLATVKGNRGIESIATPPPGSALQGWILALGERILSGGHHSGWLLRGNDKIRLRVNRRDDFDITAAEFLPNGDLLLLERRFSLTQGSAVRIRRLSHHDLTIENIQRRILLDGVDLLTADLTHQIDNMEGMAVWQKEDQTIMITLMSDDNFNFFQRTLLLEFEIRSEEFGVTPRPRPLLAQDLLPKPVDG